MKKIKVRITFIEAVLGTWPSNQNIAREFIASKSPDASTIEDEVAALGADAVADKGMTVFPRNESGDPILYDYQINIPYYNRAAVLSCIASGVALVSGIRWRCYGAVICSIVSQVVQYSWIHRHTTAKKCGK